MPASIGTGTWGFFERGTHFAEFFRAGKMTSKRGVFVVFLGAKCGAINQVDEAAQAGRSTGFDRSFV
jgi:hypothetical protein